MNGDRDERDGDEPNRWHLDKRLNIGHLLTTLVLAMALIGWGNTMDRRVAIVETQMVSMARDNDKQDRSLDENSKLLREELKGVRDDLRGLSLKMDEVSYYGARRQGATKP